MNSGASRGLIMVLIQLPRRWYWYQCNILTFNIQNNEENIISTILTLAATGTMTLTTSCEDQLDIEQKGVILTENFYKTDADAEAALVAAYEGFMCNVVGRNHDGGGPSIYTPLKLILNECGDDVLAAGANSGDNTFGIMLNQFYYDAEAEVPKHMYTGLYHSVYDCNLVLDHFAKGTTAVQKRCAAEARVLRAYDYFLLANLWGTPPLVTKLWILLHSLLIVIRILSIL